MSESFDEEWTERMTDEIYEKVDLVLENDVDISDIRCYQSVCAAYLGFVDEDDAEAFASSTGHDRKYEFEYEPMPSIELNNDSSHHKKNNYEVLIKKRGVSALSTEPDGGAPKQRPRIIGSCQPGAVYQRDHRWSF